MFAVLQQHLTADDEGAGHTADRISATPGSVLSGATVDDQLDQADAAVVDLQGELDAILAGETNVPEVSVWHSSFGAIDLTGATDVRANLALADAAGLTKRLRPGTYRIASNLTLTGTWIIPRGAILKLDPGVSVTVDGTFRADRWQIFDVSAAGSSVKPGRNYRGFVAFPEWFGAKRDTRFFYDGSVVSGNVGLTSATAGFSSADHGKMLYAITGIGIQSGTKINNTSGNTATMSLPATQTATGVWFGVGSDDFPAVKAAYDFVAGQNDTGGRISLDTGGYGLSDSLIIRHIATHLVGASTGSQPNSPDLQGRGSRLVQFTAGKPTLQMGDDTGPIRHCYVADVLLMGAGVGLQLNVPGSIQGRAIVNCTFERVHGNWNWSHGCEFKDRVFINEFISCTWSSNGLAGDGAGIYCDGHTNANNKHKFGRISGNPVGWQVSERSDVGEYGQAMSFEGIEWSNNKGPAVYGSRFAAVLMATNHFEHNNEDDVAATGGAMDVSTASLTSGVTVPAANSTTLYGTGDISLSASTLEVHSASNLTASGQVVINGQVISYTGRTTSGTPHTLTGVTGGSGTAPAGSTVSQSFTLTASGGFPASWPAANGRAQLSTGQRFSYIAKTATELQGCVLISGPTGAVSSGATINRAKYLTITSGAFKVYHRERYIDVPGAGPAGALLTSTIRRFISSNEVELRDAASTTVTGQSVTLKDGPHIVWPGVSMGVALIANNFAGSLKMRRAVKFITDDGGNRAIGITVLSYNYTAFLEPLPVEMADGTRVFAVVSDKLFGAEDLTIAVGPATATTTTRDGKLVIQGKWWNGTESQSVDMDWRHNVTSTAGASQAELWLGPPGAQSKWWQVDSTGKARLSPFDEGAQVRTGAARVQAAEQVVNNSTALVDSNTLRITVEPGTYQVRVGVEYRSSSVANLKVRVTGGSGKLAWTYLPIGSTGGTVVPAFSPVSIGADRTIGGIDGGDRSATAEGHIVVPVTTEVKVQFAQNVAEATDTKLLAGSLLELVKV